MQSINRSVFVCPPKIGFLRPCFSTAVQCGPFGVDTNTHPRREGRRGEGQRKNHFNRYRARTFDTVDNSD